MIKARVTKTRAPKCNCESCGEALKVTAESNRFIYECQHGCSHCKRCNHWHPRGHVCDVPPPPSAICAFCGSRALRRWLQKPRRWELHCYGEPSCYVCIDCMEWTHRDDRNAPKCIYCGDTDIFPRCSECAKEFVCSTCTPVHWREEREPRWIC